MARLDDRTMANMEAALEKACSGFAHGGDHETRKYIAQKLRLSAMRGNTERSGPRRTAEFVEAEVGLASFQFYIIVIAREGGRSSTPRPIDPIIGASGILDRPLEPVIGRPFGRPVGGR
jgi:hypothetical protein